MHFVKGKESDFVLNLVISKWGKKGQTNKDIKHCKRFVRKKESLERNSVCGQDWLRVE